MQSGSTVLEPELILILLSLAGVGFIFLTAWRRSRTGQAQASDVSTWLLEQMVVLAVLIVFVTITFLIFSLKFIS
jgi:hypothetical protein